MAIGTKDDDANSARADAAASSAASSSAAGGGAEAVTGVEVSYVRRVSQRCIYAGEISRPFQ